MEEAGKMEEEEEEDMADITAMAIGQAEDLKMDEKGFPGIAF
jgi:hypothetical protein